MFSKTIRILTMLTIIAATFAYTPTARADDISETKGFRKAVTLAGIREHQAAFQAIADANNDTRLASTTGHDDSAQYVYDKLVRPVITSASRNLNSNWSPMSPHRNSHRYHRTPSRTWMAWTSLQCPIREVEMSQHL